MALLSKGDTLRQQDRCEEAIAVYDEVVRRFGEATEAELREPVADAFNSIGFSLLCTAKKIWKDKNEPAAIVLLSQALKKIEVALQRKPDEPIFLGNQGYILFLLGRHDEARLILNKAIALGGEELRQAELSDADIHSLPQDEAFRALIQSLGVGQINN